MRSIYTAPTQGNPIKTLLAALGILIIGHFAGFLYGVLVYYNPIFFSIF